MLGSRGRTVLTGQRAVARASLANNETAVVFVEALAERNLSRCSTRKASWRPARRIAVMLRLWLACDSH